MIDSKTSVLIISDGRIGHIHRSEGLFEAINKFHSTSVRTLKISSNFLIPKALLPRLARILSPKLYLWFVHGLRGQAWRGMFDAVPASDGDLSHLTLGDGEILPANVGFLLSADCVHESMIQPTSIPRSFLRIALPVEFCF